MESLVADEADLDETTCEEATGDQQSPAVSDMEREWMAELQAAQRHCDQLDLVRTAAEADAKRAKKNHEAAVDALQELVRRGPSSQLPLDFKDGEQAELTDTEKRHAYQMSQPIIDAIELTGKQEEKLSDAGVKTVGDFERLRAGQHPDFPGGLSDLPRVGQSTIDKWESELIQWLKETGEDSESDSTLADEVADKFKSAGLMG